MKSWKKLLTIQNTVFRCAFFVLFVGIFSLSAHVVHAEKILYWPMTEDSSTFFDESNNGIDISITFDGTEDSDKIFLPVTGRINNGIDILNQSTPNAGKPGPGATLEVTDPEIPCGGGFFSSCVSTSKIAGRIRDTDTFRIELYFRPKLRPQDQYIFSLSDGLGGNNPSVNFAIKQEGRDIYIFVRNRDVGGSSGERLGPIAISLTERNYLNFTYMPSGWSAYVRTASGGVTSATGGTSPLNWENDFIFKVGYIERIPRSGADSGDPTRDFWEGTIYQIAMYDGAQFRDEICDNTLQSCIDNGWISTDKDNDGFADPFYEGGRDCDDDDEDIDNIVATTIDGCIWGVNVFDPNFPNSFQNLDNPTSLCERPTHSCTNGEWTACSGAVLPVWGSDNNCDTIDDDCDGIFNDDFNRTSCQLGVVNEDSICTFGTGECTVEASGQSCNGLAVDVTTLPTNCASSCNAIGPRAEVCNTEDPSGIGVSDGKDENCNGLVDEIFSDLGLGCTAGEVAGDNDCSITGINICNSSGNDTQCSVLAGRNSFPVIEFCDDYIDGEPNLSTNAEICLGGQCFGTPITCPLVSNEDSACISYTPNGSDTNPVCDLNITTGTCYINNECELAGEEPGNECRVCNSGSLFWANVRSGDPCVDDGLYCTPPGNDRCNGAGTCVGSGSVCVVRTGFTLTDEKEPADGDPDPKCDCKYTLSAGYCRAENGDAIQEGAANPDNSCEICKAGGVWGAAGNLGGIACGVDDFNVCTRNICEKIPNSDRASCVEKQNFGMQCDLDGIPDNECTQDICKANNFGNGISCQVENFVNRPCNLNDTNICKNFICQQVPPQNPLASCVGINVDGICATDFNECTDDVCINGFCDNPPTSITNLGIADRCLINNQCIVGDTRQPAGRNNCQYCDPSNPLEWSLIRAGDFDPSCNDGDSLTFPDTCDPNGICVGPGSEICNDGRDNDGDGLIDLADREDCECDSDNNETRDCDGSNVGACNAGFNICENFLWQPGCSEQTGPKAEQCNTVDDNCDGIIDNDTGGGDPNNGCDGVCILPNTLGGTCDSPDDSDLCTTDGDVYVCNIQNINDTICEDRNGSQDEQCLPNGFGNFVDENCDGTFDEGCNIVRDEICNNGIDDDGNGLVDMADREVCECRGADTQNCAGNSIGECNPGQLLCDFIQFRWYDDEFGNNECFEFQGPVPETGPLCSDTFDNDCDGFSDGSDPDCGVCEPGTPEDCPAGATDIGECSIGERICQGNREWGPCIGFQGPDDEICGNVFDENCNNVLDDGCAIPPPVITPVIPPVPAGGGARGGIKGVFIPGLGVDETDLNRDRSILGARALFVCTGQQGVIIESLFNAGGAAAQYTWGIDGISGISRIGTGQSVRVNIPDSDNARDIYRGTLNVVSGNDRADSVFYLIVSVAKSQGGTCEVPK